MPKLRDPNLRGDLYAKIQVALPKNLNQEEKRLIQQLKDLRNRK